MRGCRVDMVLHAGDSGDGTTRAVALCNELDLQHYGKQRRRSGTKGIRNQGEIAVALCNELDLRRNGSIRLRFGLEETWWNS